MESRLDTFNTWSHSAPSPQTLAAAGFFFTGDADLVRCHQCGIGLKDFSPVDDPLSEHIKHACSCDFLIDLYGITELEQKRCLINDPETLKRRQLESLHTQTAPDRTYRRPEYASNEARLATFDGWPEHVSQKPHQLADAGLYFTGVEDHVWCFACDGGLRNWDEGDDPLVEHCRWFPACHFARTSKRDKSVKLIQASVDQGEVLSELCLLNNPGTSRRRHYTQTAPDRTYRRPEYASYEARLATFDGWPEHVSQKPHQLADAGLYFTGVNDHIGCFAYDGSLRQLEAGDYALNTPASFARYFIFQQSTTIMIGVKDHVRCFACDGGLRQWDEGDDPWLEHCRWFPACPFARTSKGDEFVELIQAFVDQGEEFSELEETRPSGKDNIRLGLTELERTWTAQEIEKDALQHRKYGNISPTLKDLNIRKRNEIRPIQQEAAAAVDRHESIFEENSRLKHILKCQRCNVNNVNALFLPCAHHRMCMECASKYDVTVCPICDRPIREIVKTFMG